MLPAEADHIFTELIVLLVLLPVSPVQPGNLVILTVGIVIAKLGIQEFIPRNEHGRSTAAHQASKGILCKLVRELQHIFIFGIALYATVPASVVIGPVRIVPAVILIMLLIIGIEITKGKTVMAGDKINR